MAKLEEIVDQIRDLPLEDLTVLAPALQDVIRTKATHALKDEEERMNHLRELAGMKRKPGPRVGVKRAKQTATTGTGNGRRRGRPPKSRLREREQQPEPISAE